MLRTADVCWAGREDRIGFSAFVFSWRVLFPNQLASASQLETADELGAERSNARLWGLSRGWLRDRRKY